MKQIWKFPLQVATFQYIHMPEGAEVLTVQEQDNIPCIWAKVDPEIGSKSYAICMLGTGHSIPPQAYEGKYLGTVQLDGGRLVLHVFEAG